MHQEDKPVAQPEPQGMPTVENPKAADEEIYIPDYVMHDFGFVKETSADK